MSVFRKVIGAIKTWYKILLALIAIYPAYQIYSTYLTTEKDKSRQAKILVEETEDLLGFELASVDKIAMSFVEGSILTPESRKRLLKARRKIDDLKSIDPDNESIKMLRLAYLVNFGDIKTIERIAEEEFPEIHKPSLLAMLGIMSMNSHGSIDLAINYFKEVVRLEPNDHRVRALLGSILLANNNPEEAIEQINEAIRIAPQGIVYRNELARALIEIDEIPLAVVLLTELIDNNVGNADTYNVLGAIKTYKGEFEKSISLFKKAIKMRNTKAIYYLNVSFSYRKLGDNKNANKYLNIAKKMGTLPEGLLSFKEAVISND